LLRGLEGIFIRSNLRFREPTKVPCAQERHVIPLEADAAANRIPEQEELIDV
jgi:hypothetical protein